MYVCTSQMSFFLYLQEKAESELKMNMDDLEAQLR